jgi:putative nucleotidyltransferase with HDIG domain
MRKVRIHPLLKEIAGIFMQQGKQVFLVGGAVRDIFRGRGAQDWDLATDAIPPEVTAMFPKVIPTGIKHGTVTISYKGCSMEVTTFRTESGYHDGRRPDRVDYAASIEEDLSRRDFTMNAIALSLPEGRVVDPFGGVKDIRSRIIRCVGKPLERFAEDGLRTLRAVRFASQLGFEIDTPTLAAIHPSLNVTAKVASERVRDEINKIIKSPKPSRAFHLMEETGLLVLALPELAACRGVEQPDFHRFDVLDHSILACDFAASEEAPLPVRLAALLHDIGKPATGAVNSAGRLTFYQHERVSAELGRHILSRLHYPHDLIETVVHLIEEHMFHYEPVWSGAAVRRFIIRVGEAYLPLLYQLRRSDTYAHTGAVPPPDLLLPLISRVDEERARSRRAFSLKDLQIRGEDLMGIGIKPGPSMGAVFQELFETVVDDPELNTKEKLLEIAANLTRQP